MPDAGVAVLKGNLGPDGAVDQRRRPEEIWRLGLHCARVRGRGSPRRCGPQPEPSSAARFSSSATKVWSAAPVREMLGVTALIYGQGMGERSRSSPTVASPVRRAECASATSRRNPCRRRPLALVRDGDRIRIDAGARRRIWSLRSVELAQRRQAYRRGRRDIGQGRLPNMHVWSVRCPAAPSRMRELPNGPWFDQAGDGSATKS